MTTSSHHSFSMSSTSTKEHSLSLIEIEQLTYQIHRYSSCSTNYLPENILIDCPTNQSSRWSAHTNNPPQFLTLKLKRPAIVKQIKFGKFEKPHVCNIKKFRIFGGLDEDRMVQLFEGGLKNDNVPETFNLRSITEDGTENLPILYIKIVPLLSWGPTFNFSIWYIELHGQDDPMYTSNCMINYNMLREVEIVKLCLKHFRQQGYELAFKALQEQTQVQLEHPLISQLHNCLVLNGDFIKAEQFIVQCVNEGLMDDYFNRQDYRHKWSLQQTTNGTEQPGTRGGHQLVLDPQKCLIYLFGGWDGFQDVSDLWVYEIVENNWTLLYKESELYNGPTPRSCHKMVFDPISENIFVLGRYLDNSIRTTDYIKSDFFLYDTRARTWLQICDDTSQVGGPQLVYDHQMCIDADKRTIYVFGGKILTPRSVSAATSNEPEYSGLFSYHIATNTWTQIFVDCHHPTAANADVQSIKSRVTHCMVFDTQNRKLYIYGGQRGKEDMDDFLSYDVDTQIVSKIQKEHADVNDARHEPMLGYTLRATIDSDRGEIYVFSSLSKVKDRRDTHHVDESNSFWVYSIQRNSWSRIYTFRHNVDQKDQRINRNTILEPCPRYAHQLVYDEKAKLHYLFGGNPGKSGLPQLRLDDFWILHLEKPKRQEIINHCRFLVRKLRYEEMTRNNPMKAMSYLRERIAEVIDHNDVEQLNSFHKLAALLFKTDDNNFESLSLTTTPPLGKSFDDDVYVEATSIIDEDMIIKSEQPNDDLSMESYDSSATSSSSMSSSLVQHHKSTDLNMRRDIEHKLKSQRAFLFNKLVRLMPGHMVQPERNLSDFVIM